MNELTLTNNEVDFMQKLNSATGHSTIPLIPQIKFDAQTGEFMRELPEKDEDNKIAFESIGNEITAHIILMRKMVQSDFNSTEKLFSREFQGDYVEMLDENKNIVLKGFYKALKAANPNLKFIQVLYCFVDDKPYRIKLSGSKLTKWFPYVGSFRYDNPACWLTKISCGEQVKNGAVKYYELLFIKDIAVEKPLIVKRVNDVNQYLAVYTANRDKKVIEPIKEEYDEEIPQAGHTEDDEQIDVDDILL